MTAELERQVAVRWRDCDPQGHVNNAVYLTYLEECRDAFYEQTFGSPVYLVVRLEIDFRAEIRREEKYVLVRIGVERVGSTSLTTTETIVTASGEVAAQARVITVRWDGEQRAAIPITDQQRAVLAGAARTPEQGPIGR